MKVIILAGGLGTRLSEYTDLIPKPMVRIGGKPILWHIMNSYAKYGYKDFYIALGYKADVVKDYFLNYRILNSDFTTNLGNGSVTPHILDDTDWTVTLVNTGDHTMTGGRLKRLKKFVDGERFMLSYGDGVSDVNISKLVAEHHSNKKEVTLTAVRPPARFGEMELVEKNVVSFREKPQINAGWINGGFFVMEPSIFNYIENDETVLERRPLELLSSKGQLNAYKHTGYWQCMDTKRDHDALEAQWLSGNAPWK